MSAWANNDIASSKPKFPTLRGSREVRQFVTANTTLGGNTVITFTYSDGFQSNLANVGVVVGQYVYGVGPLANGVSANGVAGFFKSNNAVAYISGNNIVLNSAVSITVPAGSTVEFDTGITYSTSKSGGNTYYDTVLVTDTRLANVANSYGANGGSGNSRFILGSLNSGWAKFTKKTNNDGTVRYFRETLVVLANPTAANVNSGNTTWGQAWFGL